MDFQRTLLILFGFIAIAIFQISPTEEVKENREDDATQNEKKALYWDKSIYPFSCRNDGKRCEGLEDKVWPLNFDAMRGDNRGWVSTKISKMADGTQQTSNGIASESNATHFMKSYVRSHQHHRRRNRRMRDHVKRDRDPELNYGSHLIEGDIRLSQKYLKTRIERKLREMADLGDYVDVVEEDMAHLGDESQKCTETAKGQNISKYGERENVTSYSWEGGMVRYTFADNYTAEQRHTILDAMNNLAELVNSGSDNKTCISYTPYDPDKDKDKEYIWFYPGEGCESPVGAPHDEGNRHVSLGSGCMHRGTVQHELIHILGFWHEQSRTDRDKYVDIKFENIEDGICDNFKMFADPIDDGMELPYDLRSIMHYKSTAFSKNGKDTIVPKNGMPPSQLGQREKPSDIDIMKVRLRYNCTAKKDPSEYAKLLKIPLTKEA